MVNRKLYQWGWLPVLWLLITACHAGGPKKLNRRITLWHKDKIPYGTYIAYESLPHLFPDADIMINRTPPSALRTGERKKVYIIIVPSMRPDESEMNAILNFVGQGNHVFISAFQFGDSLLHSLSLRPGLTHGFSNNGDSLRLSVYQPITRDSLSFAYPGQAYDNWIRSLDSQYTTVLGRDERGRPDLVKFNYKGGGSLTLHFAPMAFTNFFLLHKNNKAYYDNVFSYLPGNVTEVIWDEYFRYDRSKGFSAFQYILGNQALRWAFWLVLLLFALIYLFDSKRKQRAIPVINPLRNSSMEFVKTIGRLYYQRRDNNNLALKMVTHFQDHVRNRYHLQAGTLDEGFIERLAYKSGFDKSSLENLAEDMKRLTEQGYLTDEALKELYRKLEEFYKIA
jgi:hypothetical protein